MSNGPLSFGPKPWDYIYFVDALRTSDNYYKVYEKIVQYFKIWRVSFSGRRKYDLFQMI